MFSAKRKKVGKCIRQSERQKGSGAILKKKRKKKEKETEEEKGKKRREI